MNEGFNEGWNNFKFNERDYNFFPTSSNAFYVTEKSLLPDESIVVSKDFFLPEEYRNIDDPKFLASYFNRSSEFNINFNTIMYLINIYKEMPLKKNYVWFHNSNFNNQEDLLLFFQENALTYLKCNLIQENEKNEIESFLKNAKLFLIKRPFNLIEHAVLSKIANLPIGCTGDISLSLALRYSKYKPIYEIDPWKQSFFFDSFFPKHTIPYFYRDISYLDQSVDLGQRIALIGCPFSRQPIEVNTFMDMQKNKNSTFTELIVKLIENVMDNGKS